MGLLLGVLALVTPDAQAFCGTYVGSPGSKLENGNSQVVMVHESSRTTLTLMNDYTGDPTEFALIIPVPQVLEASDVRVIEPDAVVRADTFSAPRLVSYSEPLPGGCGGVQAINLDEDAPDVDGDDQGLEQNLSDQVTVESSFAAGSYDIVVLSAEESEGLFVWLEDNGYAAPVGSEAMINEYIASGVYFLAAKVRLQSSGNGDTLPPLQISYDADVMSLPLRLGTTSSAGEQDLVVLAVTRATDGTVGIQNYPEAQIEDECMWPAEGGESFSTYYDDTFNKARETAETEDDEGPSWVKEYAWSPYHCDPCTDTPLTDAELQELGFTGTAADGYLTRLHLRYGPGDLDQDPVFYASGTADQSQIRYIEYDSELDEQFEICQNKQTSFTALAGHAGACRAPMPASFGAGAVVMLLALSRARRGSAPRPSSDASPAPRRGA